MAKKKLAISTEEKRRLVNPKDGSFSIREQCELLGLSRSSYYYWQASSESAENLRLMRLIDETFLRYPFFGSRQMRDYLRLNMCLQVNRKRVQRLMRLMGISSVSPGPRTTRRQASHEVYPCLLRNVEITRKDQVCVNEQTSSLNANREDTDVGLRRKNLKI